MINYLSLLIKAHENIKELKNENIILKRKIASCAMCKVRTELEKKEETEDVQGKK